MPATITDTFRHTTGSAPACRPRRHENLPRCTCARVAAALGVGAALTMAAVVWLSNVRVSTGPDAGTSFAGAAAVPATRASLRSASSTFMAGGGRTRTATLHERPMPARSGPGGHERSAGSETVVADRSMPAVGRIARRVVVVRPHRWWWDGSFGNGLLCRLPVSAWQRIPLPRAGAHTYRNAVFSTIDVGAHTVRVLLTHLDSRDAERRHEQMRMVGELFLSSAAGDPDGGYEHVPG